MTFWQMYKCKQNEETHDLQKKHVLPEITSSSLVQESWRPKVQVPGSFSKIWKSLE